MKTWVHDFGKFKMVLDESDKDLSRQVKFTGAYNDEKLETAVIRENLKPGYTMVDIGANLGFYSMLAASLVGNAGRVFSFEPFAHNVDLIRASARENGFDNVKVINCAVSDKIGSAKLYLSPYYSSEHSLFDYHYSTGSDSTENTVDVKTVTIDQYLESEVGDLRVDFIKMDIEGSEGKAISGMEKTITENKNVSLLTEFWPNAIANSGVEPKEYLERLAGFGFRLFHIDGLEQRVYPVTASQILDIMKRRSAEGFEDYKEIALGGWYTTLLCKK
ncbi:MAG: FkbM family methyltransferase [Candidatus Nitrosotenuis sp.]